MITAVVGAAAPVQLQLKDGMTGLYPRAILKNAAGVVLTTVNLADAGDGLYIATYPFASVGYFSATYRVYTDALRTVELPAYELITDLYRINDQPADQTLQANVIWGALLSGYSNPDSAGYRLSHVLDGVASAVWSANLSTYTDHHSAGYIVYQFSPENFVTYLGQAVWGAHPSDYTQPNTFGDYMAVIRQWSEVTNNEIVHGDHGLVAIRSAIDNQTLTLAAKDNQTQALVNTLPGQIAAARDAILTDVDQTKIAVGGVSTQVSALQTSNTMLEQQTQAQLAQIKSKTDTIVSNAATTTDAANILAAISTLPTLNTIINQLHILRDEIRGMDGRTTSDVYNKFDLTAVAKTNDPRFANLDAAVSSRSTLTAANVWAYATRTLTSITLDTASAAVIWNYLATQANVPGSIGARIGQYLDAAVSSRSTTQEVEQLLTDVLTDSDLAAFIGPLTSQLNANEVALTLITTLVEAIKPKTDLIPNSAATEASLENATNAIESMIGNLQATANAIQAKTTLIPLDPARAGQVEAIPTNPLRDNDARLTNLDRKISLTSTLQPTDLQPLATKTDLLTATSPIASVVGQTFTLAQEINADLMQVPTGSVIDQKLVPIAKAAALSATQTAILQAIAALGQASGGGGATAAEIWSYTARTLTSNSFPDLSQLATKTDLAALAKTQHINQMTTTFRNATQDQELVVWAEKDGARVTGSSSAAVQIRDASGNAVWGATLTTPNADGVFRFVNPIVVTADQNYYVVISIIVDGLARVSQRSFFTVG